MRYLFVELICTYALMSHQNTNVAYAKKKFVLYCYKIQTHMGVETDRLRPKLHPIPYEVHYFIVHYDQV